MAIWVYKLQLTSVYVYIIITQGCEPSNVHNDTNIKNGKVNVRIVSI